FVLRRATVAKPVIARRWVGAFDGTPRIIRSLAPKQKPLSSSEGLAQGRYWRYMIHDAPPHLQELSVARGPPPVATTAPRDGAPPRGEEAAAHRGGLPPEVPHEQGEGDRARRLAGRPHIRSTWAPAVPWRVTARPSRARRARGSTSPRLRGWRRAGVPRPLPGRRSFTALPPRCQRWCQRGRFWPSPVVARLA